MACWSRWPGGADCCCPKSPWSTVGIALPLSSKPVEKRGLVPMRGNEAPLWKPSLPRFSEITIFSKDVLHSAPGWRFVGHSARGIEDRYSLPQRGVMVTSQVLQG